jgi:putative acetyltransferase
MVEKLPLALNTIEIKPIEPHQVEDVKRVILMVGRKLYRWEAPLVEISKQLDQRGELSDIDNFQSYYFERQGIFLVVTANNEMIGSGAVRRIDNEVCELKRLWLFEAYQGKGIGYQVLQELIDFARTSGYRRMRLETGEEQERAIQLYQRVGFENTKKYNNRNSDVYMELEI